MRSSRIAPGVKRCGTFGKKRVSTKVMASANPAISGARNRHHYVETFHRSLQALVLDERFAECIRQVLLEWIERRQFIGGLVRIMAHGTQGTGNYYLRDARIPGGAQQIPRADHICLE